VTTPTERLERRYQLLLHCYPAAWRRHRGDEMIAVLLAQAEDEGRATVSLAAAVDLVGHGLEERLEALLRWLPASLRRPVATVSLTVAAGLALVMLAGEVIGAHDRLPPEEIHTHSQYFTSGPFLTIGVGMYVAYLSAALLVVLGHGGLGRLLALLTVGYAAWMRWPLWFGGGYPTPRPMVLVLFGLLGVLIALSTIRADRRTARRLVGFGAAFVVALVLGGALTKFWLDWSVGTLTTSGNVALATLATVLPLVGGAALLIAAVFSGRYPGWPAAIAVAAFPVVLFCTAVSREVNPARADSRALIPVCYLAVLGLVALSHHVGRRRIIAG
jgi:hypothetical protein